MTDYQDTTFKKVCFHMRVSTNSQDVEMQINAAARFRELYPEEDIVTISEFGVSSNKISMKHRKHLLELIEMVKRDEICKLYVYDRSRLTRRFYEYFYLYSLFWEHKVEVIYTTTDSHYPPFSQDIVTEGINALLVEEEGRNISRRSQDTFKKIPNRKFGYIKKKNDNGRKYLLDHEFQGAINTFFNNLRTIESLKELHQAVSILKKSSKRSLKMIYSMIIDPFYSGYEKSNDKLYPLPYVKPYITVEQFEENVSKFEPLLKELVLTETELILQDVFSIKCGYCSKKLKYSFDAVSNESFYFCNCASKKKQKVRYDYLEIRKVVTTTVLTYLHQVNLDFLKSVSLQVLKKTEEKLTDLRKRLACELREKEIALALMDLPKLHPANIQMDLEAIKQLKNNCVSLDTDIGLFSLAKSQIHEHIQIIENQLTTTFSEEQLISLAPSIIEEVIAYHDKIGVIQFLSEGMQTAENIQILEVTEE